MLELLYEIIRFTGLDILTIYFLIIAILVLIEIYYDLNRNRIFQENIRRYINSITNENGDTEKQYGSDFLYTKNLMVIKEKTEDGKTRVRFVKQMKRKDCNFINNFT